MGLWLATVPFLFVSIAKLRFVTPLHTKNVLRAILLSITSCNCLFDGI